MYPVGGFVYIGDDKLNSSQGPFKILEMVKLFESSPNIYYDLEGLDILYRYDELRPASKEEDLYDKMTQNLEIKI